MSYPSPRAFLPFLVLILGTAASGQFGKDVQPGTGIALLAEADSELAAIVKAAPEARKDLVEAFAQKRARPLLEAWKRARSPELASLFRRLVRHEDWQVVHRALFALEALGDPTAIPEMLPALAHEEKRVRERAALAILGLGAQGVAVGDVMAHLARESDPCVRRALQALAAAAGGQDPRHRLVEEIVIRTTREVMIAPFLEGMDKLRSAAPNVNLKPEARQGGALAKMPTAGWSAPVCGYGDEPTKGLNLQPFANLRQNGKVHHTGVDMAGCLEGAGLYAVADGSVRLLHTGSDMGTVIVVEHLDDSRQSITAVYMHAGPVVYVAAGDKVVAGQLLGTIGLAYSIENGGHFAHLHLGLYPGGYSATHNYGYKPVADGLDDWIDPAKFLPPRIASSEPLMPELGPFSKALDRAKQLADKGEWFKALTEAQSARDAAPEGDPVRSEAQLFLTALVRVPARVILRAGARMNAGRVKAAMDDLRRSVRGLGDMSDAEAVRERLALWEADPAVKKALEGESKVESAEKRRPTLKDVEKRRALVESLRKEYGDTPLAGRISALLD